jgi:uncharacterized repeat protein (TIGR01451 family)
MNFRITANSSKRTLLSIASILLFVCVFTGSFFALVTSPPWGETVIVNRAEATYSDADGTTYQTVSDTVITTVLAVPALAITPDETAPSAIVTPNEQITRFFSICNTGNVEDIFLPTRGEVSTPAAITNIYFDSDSSGTVTPGDVPVQIGQTLTPRLVPGTCHGVLFEIQTNNIAPQTLVTIGLTARSTLASPNGGVVQDNGTIINSAGIGAIFTSPANPSLPPLGLVENLALTTGAPGQVLNYSIVFRNGGSVAARQVRVMDDLPVELEYVAGTLRLNNRSLTDIADEDEGTATARHIELLIPEIAPDAVTELKFQARLSSTNTIGNGVINIASLSAANAPSVNTSVAAVIVNPIGTLYAGSSGGSVRIAGAHVKVAVDETGTPLNLVQNAGYSPNAENTNPFASDATGGFGFVLADNQMGTAGNPVRYLVTVTAPGYRPRILEAYVQPSGANGFYQASVRALDGQAIASANSFSLTNEPVDLNNLAALVFNIPMFELSSLEISKSADKQSAQIGDIVSYRIQIRNATASTINSAFVRDVLPLSFVYAAATAQIEIAGNARNLEPEVSGNLLTFNIGELGAGMSAAISYRLRVSASASEGEHMNSAVATGVQQNGEIITTEPGRAVVRVRGGVFSTRQIVIGRVFEDRNGNGQFDAGERPVAGARIYMNNGQSVLTDAAGQYNLPAVSPGSLVLSLDPITLPDNYKLLDDAGRKSSNSWTRLLRTPLGGGSLLRQNFAIAPGKAEFAVSDSVKVIAAKGSFMPEFQATKEIAGADSERKKPIQIASLNNALPLNAPVKADTTRAASGKSSETYTVESTETTEPVAPGKLLVLSPHPEDVIMSPALAVKASVANNWTIDGEVNGKKLDAGSIGETRVNNRSQVTTLSFVGISLRPGANVLKLTAVGAKGERGTTVEFKVYGRGPTEKLEIIPAKSTVQTGGLDALQVEIRAFDRWGRPAADAQISIETSVGKIFGERSPNPATDAGGPARQQMVSLKNGIATVQLIGDGSADVAHLKAIAGQHEATADVRFMAEMRPTLMAGLAEFSFGRAAPEISSTGDDEKTRGRLAFYYRSRLFGNNLLTLAYDSQQPLNRVAGRDRLGEFDPLDRAYPIFGDSSTRFEDAQSNSKIYARLDRGRSYAMFGDMTADLDKPTLTGYGRRLTGAKFHLENASGDFVSLTGARPDTAFARDVIPGGGLSLVRLSHDEILAGSEVVTLEVRDRRNPEIVLSRENLIRSIDYNLNPLIGEIFFMRPISTFDHLLNLVQVVVTYEHRGGNASNYVYTGRAERTVKRFGLRLGASYINQQQGEVGSFQVSGVDIVKALPLGGSLNFEAALSRGKFASGVKVFDFYGGGSDTAQTDDAGREHNGLAVTVKLDQPLPFFQSRLRADFQRSTPDFYNPFGATMAPGNQRFFVGLEMRPASKRTFSFGFTDERNKTRNVGNSRRTFSALWSEQWFDNLRTTLGFEHRRFDDELSDRDVNSNLVTAAIEYRPTSKLEFSLKREQNLGEADPTYPNQTIFSAKYALNSNARLFFTQRLASAPITPIGDFSGSGFTSTNSRRETAFGIETKIPRLGALSGRYQLESGVNGMDSFAVIGLQNRWALNKKVSLEAGFERGFLLSGNGDSFNSGTLGLSWTPVEGFRTSARYELRDRDGLGQLFAVGAVGKIGDNWTALARGEWMRSKFNNRSASSTNLTSAVAYRPIDSDKYALLFSYNQRSMMQTGADINGIAQKATRDRSDSLSSDGLYQVNEGLELYGRFALRFNGNGNNSTVYTSALTYLAQVRAQQRINNYLDFAVQGRWLAQPVTGTRRMSAGTEVGYWLLPDLRLGAGYNFTDVRESQGIFAVKPERGGFYFTISSKLSNIFDLFGTPRNDLATKTETTKTVNATAPAK